MYIYTEYVHAYIYVLVYVNVNQSETVNSHTYVWCVLCTHIPVQPYIYVLV